MNLVNPSAGNPEVSITIMLEPLASGQFLASAVEFPYHRVEATTKAAAIAELRQQLSEHLQKAEFAVVTIPVQVEKEPENPWLEMFGQFRESANFEDVVRIIEAERNALGDDEVDPALYLPIEPQ